MNFTAEIVSLFAAVVVAAEASYGDSFATTDRCMKSCGIRYIFELSNLGNRLGKELGGKHFRSFHFDYCIRS